MKYQPFTLSGQNVILRPLVKSDARLLAMASSESRETYLFNPVPNGIDEADEYISKAIKQASEGTRIPFAIMFSGKLVGTTSYANLETWNWPLNSDLQRRDSPDVVEIGGTWLAQSAQRTCCNSEAKFLLLKYAFEFWKVYRVSFRTDERNIRSRKAIERLGAKFEGIRRADMPSVDGIVRNSAYYSIINSEWANVHYNLIKKLENNSLVSIK